MTQRMLITGGLGYIGGRLAQALAILPEVKVVLGTRTNQEPPDWLPNASVEITCWNDFKILRKGCEGVHTVLHLAAMNEIDSERDPVGALEINGIATARLLEAAKAENVKRFVYFSTAHVYSSPLVGDIDETICPRPSHPYATSHRAAEDLVLSAHDKGLLNGIVLRVSNSFGAPAHIGVNRWTLLVNDLCKQAANTGELRLRSPGLQRRDFITLTDVSRAAVHLLGLSREELNDGVFNVGGAWTPTVFEMAGLVASRCELVLGFRPKIIRPNPAASDAAHSLNYRINKLLATGFQLTKNHETEIDATLRMCAIFSTRDLIRDKFEQF